MSAQWVRVRYSIRESADERLIGPSSNGPSERSAEMGSERGARSRGAVDRFAVDDYQDEKCLLRLRHEFERHRDERRNLQRDRVQNGHFPLPRRRPDYHGIISPEKDLQSDVRDVLREDDWDPMERSCFLEA
jgi:hypothetical protein